MPTTSRAGRTLVVLLLTGTAALSAACSRATPPTPPTVPTTADAPTASTAPTTPPASTGPAPADPVTAPTATSRPSAPPRPPSGSVAPASTSPVTAAGRHVSATLTDASGRVRSYHLYIPAAADHPDAPVPLLVVLHGGGGSGTHIESRAGFDAIADGAGFIAVYPDAVRPPNGALPTWNAGDCCGYAARTGIDDVGFVRDLISTLSSGYPIDPHRVFVAGYSNGGMLAYRVACQLSDVVAAVGVQSATLEFSPCQPSRPVSLLHIHGTADDHVPLDGGRGTAGRSRADYTPVLTAAATVATADGCGPTPAAVPDPDRSGAQVRDWTGCPPGIAVRLVTVAGAGHTWLPDSASSIWSFLAAHPAA